MLRFGPPPCAIIFSAACCERISFSGMFWSKWEFLGSIGMWRMDLMVGMDDGVVEDGGAGLLIGESITGCDGVLLGVVVLAFSFAVLGLATVCLMVSCGVDLAID